MPSFLTNIGNFLSTYRMGEIASVLGLLVTVFGFIVTIVNVVRSRTAAVRAEQAAARVSDTIRRYDTVADFSAAITIMEEIKRLHRQRAWAILPDRYSALKKLLISIRAANPNLNDGQRTTIQGTLQAILSVEQSLEETLAAPKDQEGQPDIAKFNRMISKHLDRMQEVLVALRQEMVR